MKLTVLICAVMITIFASVASAAPINVVSYAYFDVSGNLVGQSIDTCFQGNARTYAGVGSEFYLRTTQACTTGTTISGVVCIWQPGNDSPYAGSVCIPGSVSTDAPPSDPIHDGTHLPPSLSVEQACDQVVCEVPPAYAERWGQADVHSGLPPGWSP